MADLAAIVGRFHERVDAIQLSLNGRPYAQWTLEDQNLSENSLFEGVFLRAFTAFEGALEELFLHYSTGGTSLAGFVPTCRLANCNDSHVRTILRGSQRFVDWSSPQTVRERSNLFFVDGEPFRTAVEPRSQILGDIQKVRNTIAHESIEAAAAFREVLINNFRIEPPFSMSPGQLLRARRKSAPPMSWCSHYLAALSATIDAIVNLP